MPNLSKPEARRLIFVSGGQRSGKSVFAENLALELADFPTYIATATVSDDEFAHRVSVHRARRCSRWINMEEPRHLGSLRLQPQSEAALVDCLTLWATNCLYNNGVPRLFDDVFADMCAAIDSLIVLNPGKHFIFVTNEIGLGGTHADTLQRTFTDLLGNLNQYAASVCNEAYLVVSGLNIRLK